MIRLLRILCVANLILVATSSFGDDVPKRRLQGVVVDAETGQSIPARVYVQSARGSWHFVDSADPKGTAVRYDKRRQEMNAFEVHTSLSAHPFIVDLPQGNYTITIERGKEYHTLRQEIEIGSEPVEMQFKLRRWIDMGKEGWYSGDTHVHRSLEELRNVMMAEDLNVAFPLLHWVHDAFTSPDKGRPGEIDPGRLIKLDGTHVLYPRNTEYEIFAVGKKRHTLGAFFVLNHRTLLDEGVPPVGPVARKAKAEGALIELDKHNWPWSMAIVPIMPVDLFELSNNHVWRTEFGFRSFGEPAAEYMKIERDNRGFTEWGWLNFGFQNYYSLLNCGFRLRPTAGTASGVHPVPLGFGRVYVHMADGFNYDAWLRGLNAGRSFVTTGPMLFLKLNDQMPGEAINAAKEYRLTGSTQSATPLERIEIVVNGEIVTTLKPENRLTSHSACETKLDERLRIDGSSWVVVRCFEKRYDHRVRFAHSSPFHIEIEGKPLRPRKVEVEYLVSRVEAEIRRTTDILPPAALDEYREALRIYRSKLDSSR